MLFRLSVNGRGDNVSSHLLQIFRLVKFETMLPKLSLSGYKQYLIKDFMVLNVGCYMLICRDQYVCAQQAGDRGENDRVYRKCKSEHRCYC